LLGAQIYKNLFIYKYLLEDKIRCFLNNRVLISNSLSWSLALKLSIVNRCQGSKVKGQRSRCLQASGVTYDL